MFLRVSTVLLAIAALGVADTLTLRSGQVVRGQYLGGDARHVKMAVGDRVDTYSIDDVSDLAFGGPQRQSFEDRRNDRPDDRGDDAPRQWRPRCPLAGSTRGQRDGDPGRYAHYGSHDRQGGFRGNTAGPNVPRQRG